MAGHRRLLLRAPYWLLFFNCVGRHCCVCLGLQPQSASPVVPKQEQQQSSTTSGCSSRWVAAHALLRMDSDSAIQQLENNNPHFSQLSTRDRAFARLLVTTAERRRGQIDGVLAHCRHQKDDKHPTKKRKNRKSKAQLWTDAVLRLGAAQILFLDIPTYAAVKETVDLLRHPPSNGKEVGKSSSNTNATPTIRFVNAILRRLTREGPELVATQTSLRDNAALWLLQAWDGLYGISGTDSILQAALREPARTLTPMDNDNPQRTAHLFPDCQILPQGSIRIHNPPPPPLTTWPEYDAGTWWVQDVSATLPALALMSGLRLQRKQQDGPWHVADFCAAPGGKTAQLLSRKDEIASVTALEISPRRSRRLVENLERLGFLQPGADAFSEAPPDESARCRIVVADGTTWTPPKEWPALQGVLLDVPCSATGTASHRPDVLRHANPPNQQLLHTQYELACHAVDHVVAPGGILVYATCSLLHSESEDQVAKLLQRTDGRRTLHTLPIEPGEIPGFDEAIDDHGWLRVVPNALPGSLAECDGFFVARLIVEEK